MRPRRYVIVLMGAAFGLFAAVATANLLIDPQLVFGTGLVARPANVNERYVRLLQYRSTGSSADGLLFGSSRVQWGVPVAELSRRMGGIQFADFSVIAGTLSDHVPTLKYVLRDKGSRGERLRVVVLMLDIDTFGTRPLTNQGLSYLLPPEISGESAARFWWRNLTGIPHRAWTAALWGRARPDVGPTAGATAEVLAAIAAAASTSAYAQAAGEVPSRASTSPMRTAYFAENVRLLKEFIALCEGSAPLTVAILPLSTEVRLRFEADDLARAIAAIAHITPVWDFSDAGSLGEPSELWPDPIHFYPPLGRAMLERMFSEPQDARWHNFGHYRFHQ
jgi:hypothetical protein